MKTALWTAATIICGIPALGGASAVFRSPTAADVIINIVIAGLLGAAAWAACQRAFHTRGPRPARIPDEQPRRPWER